MDEKKAVTILSGVIILLVLLFGGYLYYKSTQSLTLTITDENGNPLAGALVELFDENGNKIGEAVTDENGKAMFPGVDPNQRYTYKVTRNGYDDAIGHYDPQDPDGKQIKLKEKPDPRKLDFANPPKIPPLPTPKPQPTIPGGGSGSPTPTPTGGSESTPTPRPTHYVADARLNVTVKDKTTSQPIGNAVVTLYDGATGTFLAQGSTESDGTLQFGVKQGSTVSLQARKQGFVPSDIQGVSINAAEVTTEVLLTATTGPNTGTSRINVVNQDGQPVSGARIQVFASPAILDQLTEGSGRIEATLEKGKTYGVLASKDGFNDKAAQFEPGNDVTLTLEALPAGTQLADLTVTVRNNDATPAAQARVAVLKKVFDQTIDYRTQVADESGIARFTDLSLVSVLVSATSVVGEPSVSKDVTLQSGSNAVTLDLPKPIDPPLKPPTGGTPRKVCLNEGLEFNPGGLGEVIYNYSLKDIALERAVFQVESTSDTLDPQTGQRSKAIACSTYSAACTYMLGKYSKENDNLAKSTGITLRLTSVDLIKKCVTVNVGGETCQGENCACGTEGPLVCGFDFVTYINACEAEKTPGATPWSTGACANLNCQGQYAPVCYQETQQFSNACEARLADAIPYVPGECPPPIPKKTVNIPAGFTAIGPLGDGALLSTSCRDPFGKYLFLEYIQGLGELSPLNQNQLPSLQYPVGYLVYGEQACSLTWEDKPAQTYAPILRTGYTFIAGPPQPATFNAIRGNCPAYVTPTATPTPTPNTFLCPDGLTQCQSGQTCQQRNQPLCPSCASAPCPCYQYQCATPTASSSPTPTPTPTPNAFTITQTLELTPPQADITQLAVDSDGVYAYGTLQEGTVYPVVTKILKIRLDTLQIQNQVAIPTDGGPYGFLYYHEQSGNVYYWQVTTPASNFGGFGGTYSTKITRYRASDLTQQSTKEYPSTAIKNALSIGPNLYAETSDQQLVKMDPVTLNIVAQQSGIPDNLLIGAVTDTVNIYTGSTILADKTARKINVATLQTASQTNSPIGSPVGAVNDQSGGVVYYVHNGALNKRRANDFTLVASASVPNALSAVVDANNDIAYVLGSQSGWTGVRLSDMTVLAAAYPTPEGVGSWVLAPGSVGYASVPGQYNLLTSTWTSTGKLHKLSLPTGTATTPSPTPNACTTQNGECRLQGQCPTNWLVSDPDGVAAAACGSGQLQAYQCCLAGAPTVSPSATPSPTPPPATTPSIFVRTALGLPSQSAQFQNVDPSTPLEPGKGYMIYYDGSAGATCTMGAPVCPTVAMPGCIGGTLTYPNGQTDANGCPVAPVCTPNPSPGDLAESRYSVKAALTGSVDFCDRDYYPIGSLDLEKQHAQEYVSAPEDAVEYAVILRHLNLAGVQTLTDDQKLEVYREYKRLRAIGMTSNGNGFDFSTHEKISGTQNQGGGTYLVKGTVASQTATINEKTASALNCPICLAKGTRIDTPKGPVPVEQLRQGDAVYTTNAEGKKTVGVVLKATSRSTQPGQKIVHLVLDDGRQARISQGHPLSDGRNVDELKIGDDVDHGRVTRIRVESYETGATYDILPDGPTGTYWANGILVGSTLFAR